MVMRLVGEINRALFKYFRRLKCVSRDQQACTNFVNMATFSVSTSDLDKDLDEISALLDTSEDFFDGDFLTLTSDVSRQVKIVFI